jgi:hypothetical protein
MSKCLDLDTLVNYVDDMQDQLNGRPIVVMVHPVLQVYGTDQGEDYHMARVWAKGVVCLDSKVQTS